MINNETNDHDMHFDIDYHEGHLDWHYGIHGSFSIWRMELYKTTNDENSLEESWEKEYAHWSEEEIEYDIEHEYTFLISVYGDDDELILLDNIDTDVAVNQNPNTITVGYGEDIEDYETILVSEFKPSIDEMNVMGLVTGTLFIAVPILMVFIYRFIIKRREKKNA